MIKKTVAIILALVMVFCFASCKKEKKFTLGTVNGDSYENEFIGVGYTLDEGWSFMSRADLLSEMGVDQTLSGEELEAAINQADIISDMDASIADGTESVFVQAKNMGMVFGTIMGEDKYIDMWQEALDEDYSENGNFDDVVYTKEAVDFCGRKCKSLNVHLKSGDINVYQKTIFIKIDGYMIEIVVTSVTDWNAVDGILDNFYSLAD